MRKLEISFPEEKKEKKIVQSQLVPFNGILIDVHEPDWVYNSLSSQSGLSVKRVSLGSKTGGMPGAGDYAFSNIGIERKEFDDYMHSLTSGRLWKQMIKIKSAYERPILVIEGLKDPMIQLTGMTTIRFVSSIARIIKMGVNVITVPTHSHFILLVTYLYLSSDKKIRYRQVEAKKWGRLKREIKEDMLTMIPGIGRKTAIAIMARYPVLEDLMKLSVNEIVKNTPLGPKKAKALWEVLHT